MSRVITFFSYKGGVGRTMALANIAALLALRGKRVLMLDFDLEAPGLEFYFKKFLTPNHRFDHGVLPLLLQASNGYAHDWRAHVHSFKIHSDNCTFEGSSISLMASGSDMQNYSTRLSEFSWKTFFKECNGAEILEVWREEWKREYDFIFVDSRTGVTDTGGICTVLLPDHLVFVFNTNNQSFHRGLGIIKSVQAARLANEVPKPPLLVFPLLCRFEVKEEVDLVNTWLDDCALGLVPYYNDWLPKQFHPRQMLEATRIPYIPRFSFGECLPVITHSLTEHGWPGLFFSNSARLLESDFKEAAQIIDPNVAKPKDSLVRARDLIQKRPIDEIELQNVLKIAEVETASGPEFSALLNEVGMVFHNLAQFNDAELMFRRALAIDESHYDVEHISVSMRLNNLAHTLKETNRLDEAELLYRKALDIAENFCGAEHFSVAVCLNNLAQVLNETNRLHEAESLMRRALQIDEHYFGIHAPIVALRLNNLSILLKNTNRMPEAENLMLRALKISEMNSGPDHVDVAKVAGNLGSLLIQADRLVDAEPFMRRALAINEKVFGLDHPNVAIQLNNLAQLLKASNRVSEAVPLFNRALALFERFFGSQHPKVAVCLNNLAGVHQSDRKWELAEPLLRRALAINEHSYGNEHPSVALVLNNLAQILQDTNRLGDAELMMRRALKINEKSFGLMHPSVATDLNNLAKLLRNTNRSSEAEPLLRRALNILEISYGKSHSSTLLTAGNLDILLKEAKIDKTETI